MIYYGNELYHHGIKGQKWGERNYQNPDGSWTPLGKKRRREENYSEDYKKVHDGKSYKELSTAELRERNSRLVQENNYRDNLNKQKEATRAQQLAKKGNKILHAFIAGAGTATAAVLAYKKYKSLVDGAVSSVGDMVVKDLNKKPFRF